MKNAKHQIAIASIFTWIGFVGAISFMEAWLKFQAPGITIPLGLGIGRLVFNALNKVELVLAIIITSCLFFREIYKFKLYHFFFLMPFIIVLLQSIWLLPALDTRAVMHIQGLNVLPSNLHLLYIVLEILKISCLLIFGIKLFNNKLLNYD
jgi:hypothetical protein